MIEDFKGVIRYSKYHGQKNKKDKATNNDHKTLHGKLNIELHELRE